MLYPLLEFLSQKYPGRPGDLDLCGVALQLFIARFVSADLHDAAIKSMGMSDYERSSASAVFLARKKCRNEVTMNRKSGTWSS